MKVYLAGPISGHTYDSAQDWRMKVKDSLASEGIEGYSPLRAKSYLRGKGMLEQGYEDTPLSTDRGIMTRDHFDCMTSDLIFCNLLPAGDRVSIGTVMEIAWAFAYRKPLVLVMRSSGDVHEHPMIREAIGFRTDNLDQGVNIACAILLADR